MFYRFELNSACAKRDWTTSRDCRTTIDAVASKYCYFIFVHCVSIWRKTCRVRGGSILCCFFFPVVLVEKRARLTSTADKKTSNHGVFFIFIRNSSGRRNGVTREKRYAAEPYWVISFELKRGRAVTRPCALTHPFNLSNHVIHQNLRNLRRFWM